MVRLKPDFSAKPVLVLPGFNSSMVRLKPFQYLKQKYLKFCFNSSMVRLKLLILEKNTIIIIVSIPLWCD